MYVERYTYDKLPNFLLKRLFLEVSGNLRSVLVKNKDFCRLTFSDYYNNKKRAFYFRMFPPLL